MGDLARSWQPGLRDGYGKAAQALATPGRGVLDCAMGVNPCGASPLALAAYRCDDTSLNIYPKRGAPGLAEAVVTRWSGLVPLEPGDVIATPGGDAALELAAKAFLGRGGRVVGFLPQYPEFLMEVAVRQGRYLPVERGLPVPPRRQAADPPSPDLAGLARPLAAALEKRPSLIFIDNPNNPTGRAMPLPAMMEVARAAAAIDCPVLVDEAYGDWLPDEESAITLLDRYPNVVVVRSLSKGAGLAGLRIGYLVAKGANRDALRTCVMPYPLGAAAEAAGRAGVLDTAHLGESRARVREKKAALVEYVGRLANLVAFPSHEATPILVLGLAPRLRRRAGSEVDLGEAFLAHGVAVASGRYFQGLGPGFVRLRLCLDLPLLLERLAGLDRSLTKSRQIPDKGLGEGGQEPWPSPRRRSSARSRNG